MLPAPVSSSPVSWRLVVDETVKVTGVGVGEGEGGAVGFAVGFEVGFGEVEVEGVWVGVVEGFCIDEGAGVGVAVGVGC